MLATDPGRLKLLGIDLQHSRARRRWAVVLTYFAYMAIMVSAANHAFPYGREVMWLTSACMVFFGLFGNKGPVKSFDEPRGLVRARMGSRMLDAACERNFGARFAQLPPEQQKVVMGRARASALGKYFEDPQHNIDLEAPDERELSERNRASYLSLRFMATMFVVTAVGFSEGTLHHQPDDLIATALQYAVFALTFPQAIILWTEPDPRDIPGEIELVPSPTEN